MRPRPQLLVSVRSWNEAEAALLGGADILDLKEPAAGPLGPASPEVVTEVTQWVAGRCPVTAALGELVELTDGEPASWAWLAGVRMAKVGLAGCQRQSNWQTRFDRLAQAMPTGTHLVPVHYADWQAVAAPSSTAVLAAAVACHSPWLVVDTFTKQQGDLLRYYPPGELKQLFAAARSQGLLCVAAGGLRRPSLAPVLSAGPDVIAVRGAACQEGKRAHTICPMRVAAIAESLSRGDHPAGGAEVRKVDNPSSVS